MAYLVQLFLPLYDNDGNAFTRADYAPVREELTSRFGGMTAYTRAPAEGRWEDDGKTVKDDVIVLEVMADTLERAWWETYRQKLERAFRQERILIRALSCELL